VVQLVAEFLHAGATRLHSIHNAVWRSWAAFFPDTSFLFVSGYAGKREFR